MYPNERYGYELYGQLRNIYICYANTPFHAPRPDGLTSSRWCHRRRAARAQHELRAIPTDVPKGLRASECVRTGGAAPSSTATNAHKLNTHGSVQLQANWMLTEQ